MRVTWTDLSAAAEGSAVEVTGYPMAAGGARQARRFLLLPEAACCPGHAPRDPSGAIEVFADTPMTLGNSALRLRGTWRAGEDGWRYQLQDAQPLDTPGWRAITRRGLMAAGPLMCLAGPGCAAPADGARAEAVIAAGRPIDIHSHAGGIANSNRIRQGAGYSAIAAPMRQGGMAAICLAMVSDSPTHHVVDGRIRPYRNPAAGELYAYGTLAFSRIRALVESENLRIVATAADLRATSRAAPGVIIAAEGADFLEGRLDRLEEAHARWTLRHLQLTHYRVNELGDIQTEPPEHGGLTDFGAEVIRQCNRTGIVVDVAHGTLDLVKRAAAVTTKPLVLSHTSLNNRPGPTSRQITSEHAKVIAGTGGVIGVWPSASIYPTLTAMAVGIARLVDVVGVDHAGLGSDLRGLVGGTVFADYDALPGFTEALLQAGFTEPDTVKILGGNYARVFNASMAE